MPLIKSNTPKARSQNIDELVSSYKQKDSIGTSHPGNIKDAIKQAVAISYNMKRGKHK